MDDDAWMRPAETEEEWQAQGWSNEADDEAKAQIQEAHKAGRIQYGWEQDRQAGADEQEQAGKTEADR